MAGLTASPASCWRELLVLDLSIRRPRISSCSSHATAILGMPVVSVSGVIQATTTELAENTPTASAQQRP